MTLTDKDNHWSLRAACRGKWNLFDSVEVEGKDTYPFYDQAMALCEGCPVKRDCDMQGETEPTNIWGAEVRGR